MKLWFTMMCGPGSLQDIQELWEPIKDHFTGISAVYFGDQDDLEARYLEIVKGEGRIIYLPYVGRHDLARNVALHSGAIQNGDWVMQCDTLERINPDFVKEHVLPWFGLTGIQPNLYYFHGKPFLYQYHESLVFQGTPHEGLQRRDDAKPMELNQMFPDEEKVRLNVRPIKRTDPYHWVDHYARYYISTPWGSNHCLLGNEKRGDPIKIYQEREALRIECREYLRGIGVDLTVEGLKKILTPENIPNRMKEYVNREGILNDFYRYHILKDQSVVDDHSWSGMVKI